ncbi:MAG: mismatch-specific DNA-glycosylase [Gammaproteobacteria bacterium]
METLPDYLEAGLCIVSVGLNPSVNSVRAGFYFATPQNRFWRALNASGLVDEPLTPGVDAMQTLFERYRIGFTDVVKRPSRSGSVLRAADYREWAPRLRDKLLACRPRIVWFHGKQAYGHYLRYAQNARSEGEWGLQPETVGEAAVFVTPNPSPANAAFSLEVITGYYNELATLRAQRCEA